MTDLLIVGDGAVARALATALTAAGEPVVRWWRGQGGEPPVARIAVLAVSDGAITEVARRVGAGVLLSCAGGVSVDDAFAGVVASGKGLLHPLRALAGAASDGDFTGTTFGVAGDVMGLAAARQLVDKLGGTPLVLTAESQVRYHAAAVLVSNHTLALVAAATGLLGEIGLPPREAEQALAGLLGSTVENLRTLGLPAALTGPMSRGSVGTIRAHLSSLPPQARALYQATGRALLVVAAQKGQAPNEALRQVGALLDEP